MTTGIMDRDETPTLGTFADTSQIVKDAFDHGIALADTEGDGDLDELVD